MGALTTVSSVSRSTVYTRIFAEGCSNLSSEAGPKSVGNSDADAGKSGADRPQAEEEGLEQGLGESARPGRADLDNEGRQHAPCSQAETRRRHGFRRSGGDDSAGGVAGDTPTIEKTLDAADENLKKARETGDRSKTGGMRRTHLRFHYNIARRMLIHVAGFNLGLPMRKRFGVGTPRGLQGRLAAIAAFVALIDLIGELLFVPGCQPPADRLAISDSTWLTPELVAA